MRTNQNLTKRAWNVVITISLFFFFAYIQVNLFNAINPYLLKDFNLTASQLGQLSSYYFIINAILLLPEGILLDRFSPSKFAVLSMIIGVLGTIIFSFSNSFSTLIISRIMVGICGTPCFLVCIKIASSWFPAKKMALVTGVVVTIAMLGGIVAQMPLALLIEHFGWRNALLIDASIGLVITLLIAIIVKDYPKNYTKNIEKLSQSNYCMNFFYLIKKVICNPQNILGGLFIGLITLPIYILGAMWGNMYLMQARDLTNKYSAFITSMLFFGLIIGSPLAGWISDYLQKRKLPMIIGISCSLIIVLIIICAQHLSFTILLLLYFSLGILISTQVIAYALIIESNPSFLTGTATSVASLFIIIAAVAQILFGLLLGQGSMINGEPTYSLLKYKKAMLILPVSFIIGLIASLLCKENYDSARNLDKK